MDVRLPWVAAVPTRMTGTSLSALLPLASCKQVPTQDHDSQDSRAGYKPAWQMLQVLHRGSLQVDGCVRGFSDDEVCVR